MNFGLATTFDPREVLEAANKQGAFVFWNHPDFATVDAGLNKFHRSATKSGLLHGVEIANGNSYYENAHRLALKHDLVLIGVSDVHELIEWDYRPEAEHNPGHRPVTLVLAEDSGLDAMRDALFAKRTIVWWKNTLIGRPEHLHPLLKASLSFDGVKQGRWGLTALFTNKSDAAFQLRQRSNIKLRNHAATIELAPHTPTEVGISVDDPEQDLAFEFEVLNALIAPGEAATITLTNSP